MVTAHDNKQSDETESRDGGPIYSDEDEDDSTSGPGLEEVD